MKYVVCPTCGKVLADIEIDYEIKSSEIMMSDITEKEKIVKRFIWLFLISPYFINIDLIFSKTISCVFLSLINKSKSKSTENLPSP